MKTHRQELRECFHSVTDLMVPFFVAAFILITITVAGVNPTSYGSSLTLKEQLLATTPAPRLIVMGGSGAASSIDTAHLAHLTHTAPVNMALYAGLGMRYIINDVRPEMKKGDIILLAPEYEMLQQPSYGDGFLLLEMMQANPQDIIHGLTQHGIVVMLRAFPTWIQLNAARIYTKIQDHFYPHTKTFAEKLYTIDNITSYGELNTEKDAGDHHLTLEQIHQEGDGFIRPAADPQNLLLIKNFFAEAQSRGVDAYIVIPAIPVAVAQGNIENSYAQFNALLATVGANHVIGIPEFFILPNDDFLDSIGHLTPAGKVIRTERIRQELQLRLISKKLLNP